MSNIINIIKIIWNFITSNTTCVLIAALVVLGLITTSQCSRIDDLKNENENLFNNQKAYENENSELKNTNYEFSMTVKQLKASNDTITKELMDTKKELGIKDKNLQAMAYMLSHASKTDTIVVEDTIFATPGFYLDTTLGNEWYATKLILEYPGDIIVSSEFNSQKEVFVSSKKETVDAPKKFFLFRWFQKKHYVTTVDVVEKNPYITNSTERFIKITE